MKRSRWILWGVLLCLVSLLLVSAAYAQTTYVIQLGDTLSSIALRFNTTVAAIAAANNISNPNLIYAGESIIIPTDGAPPPEPQPPTAPPPSSGGTYVIQPGDTLSGIAQRFNTTVAALAAANNIINPNYIYAGQVLTIPGGTGGTPPPQPPPPGAPPPSSSGFEVGGQTQSFASAGTMRDIGMTWVKFQHKWSPGDDPAALAGRVRDAHAKGMKVLLSVAGSNTYPAPDSINFGSFTEFMRGLASLGGDSPDAIEVWNEQNIDFEWPAGQINPTSYVNNMLAPAYNAIKGANPNVMVISGALAPTGFDNGHNAWADDRYVNGMAAAGAANYMDCIGIHHNAGATSPTVSSGHPGGSHYSWYYQPTVNVYYGGFGGSRPLCFTELGYLSAEDFGSLPGNFGWASGTSVGEHAQWLAEAVSLSNQQGRVRLLIVFNVDFTFYDQSGDPQAGYAIIRPGGGCPACNTLSSVIPR
ncbi:MAG: LysM peptidoglycan-binding domain-containing protein [Candidatus Promineifilaceae bacterium]